METDLSQRGRDLRCSERLIFSRPRINNVFKLKRIVSLSIVNLEMDEIEPEISWWDKSIVCINYIQKSSVVHLPHICSQPRWRAECSKVAKAALPCPRILHLTLCTVRASVKLFSHFAFNQNYSIGLDRDKSMNLVMNWVWRKATKSFPTHLN